MALANLLKYSATLALSSLSKASKSSNLSGINSRLSNYFCSKSGPPKEEVFRHGFAKELEAAINKQILVELNASTVYLSMYCYYGRTDIALPGCQSFFKAMYLEEQEHALDFIHYQLMRGGQVRLFPGGAPENSDWTCITVALGVALELEKKVKEDLVELVKLAECHKDYQLADFVTSTYLKGQNESICEFGRLLTKAKRVVDTGCLGRHLFDKEMYAYVREKHPDIKMPFKNI